MPQRFSHADRLSQVDGVWCRMSEKLFGDRPIAHPSDDVFGIATFAKALATSLLQMSPKDGLVISVEGPWGSGKSSAIALATREIHIRVLAGLGEGLDELEKLSQRDLEERWAAREAQRNTHIVRFNPWNFSGQENLVLAFFSELGAQVGLKPDGAVRKALGKLAGYLPSAAGVFGAAGAIALGQGALAAPAAAASRQAAEMAERALKIDDSLEGAKSKLAQALLDEGDRIIVIVDDLDRLMPSEMRSVFSLVKSLGDLPNVLYVMSFDAEIVSSVLNQGVDKIDSDFLEKIVQVSLKLPPPWREEIRRLLFSRLNEIIGDETPADQSRWERMLYGAIDPYLKTPRDVIRLANTLKVIWPNVAGDVDLTDLVAVTTLQLFEPGVYALIQDKIEETTHADYKYADDKNFGEIMLPKSAKNFEAAKDSIAMMFPRLGKIWNEYADYDGDYLTQKAQRRICTKEYYRNYFAFGRDSRRLTRSQVEAIIWSSAPNEALAAIIPTLTAPNENSGRPRLPAFLDQVLEAVHVKPLTAEFIKSVLDHSDEIIRREDITYELFRRDNLERLQSIFRFGLAKLEALHRSDVLEILTKYPSGLQLRAEVVEDAARQHGLFANATKHESERLFDFQEIEEAASSIRAQLAAYCEAGRVWEAPKPMRMIWGWWRMSDKETLKPWFDRVVGKPTTLIELANVICNRVTITGGKEGRVFRKEFNRETLYKLFDVDDFISRLDALAVTNTKAAAALREIQKAEEDSAR